MTKSTRSKVVLAVALAMASTVFRRRRRCNLQSQVAACHGAAGTPAPAMAKMMGIKPVSDPDIQKLTVAQILPPSRTARAR